MTRLLPAGAARQLSRKVPVLAFAAAIVMVGTIPAQADGADRWKVLEARGVEVKKPGASWAALEKGAVVPRGSAIRTGAKGKLVLDSTGDSVTMSPNSRMAIPAGPTGTGAVNVKQSFGTLLFRIVKRPADRFRVSTPYLAAVIKGTTFSVTVNDVGAALHVSTGAVQVTSLLSRKVVLVRPGQTAAVSSTRGTPMKLTGGNPKKKSASQGAQNDGNGKSDAAPGPERAGKKVISKAIGGGRIDVFKMTNGLIGNHEPGVHNGGAKQTKTASKGAGIGIPKSVKNALKSVSKATVAARTNVSSAGGNGKSNGKGKKK